MRDIETIEQRTRRFCSELRAEGYQTEDILSALNDEVQRLVDDLPPAVTS